MHGIGEAVPPDFYVLRLILIKVDRRVSKDIVGGGPSSATCIAHTKRDAVDAERDFNEGKLHALSLLASVFGGLREALDSDVDTPELPPVQTSTSSEPSSLKEGFEEPDLIPAIEDTQGDSGSEESPASTSVGACSRICDYSERGYEGQAQRSLRSPGRAR